MNPQQRSMKVVRLPGAWRRKNCPAWARWLHARTEYLQFDLGGGPRPLRLWQVANLQRGITIALIGALMYGYDNFSPPAWTYLGLYGACSAVSLLLDLSFPTRASMARLAVTGSGAWLLARALLHATWPWLLLSRDVSVPATVLCAAIVMHTLGIALMAGARLQTSCERRHRETALITGGLFAYTRNPGALGELLVYGSYAALAAHDLGYVVVTLQFFVLSLPHMLVKDASISRYAGWDDYEHRSGLLIPWGLLNGQAWRTRRRGAPRISGLS
jgi:protein-S-isoprenylcysteine O-methyltransferase Ste14